MIGVNIVFISETRTHKQLFTNRTTGPGKKQAYYDLAYVCVAVVIVVIVATLSKFYVLHFFICILNLYQLVFRLHYFGKQTK
jgi:hypothetical protein